MPPSYRERHLKYWIDADVKRRRSDSPIVIHPCELVRKDGTSIPVTMWIDGVDTEPYEWLVFTPPDGTELLDGVVLVTPDK